MTATMTDPVLAEVDALRQEMRGIQDRIDQLRKLRSRPSVVPVLSYDRHYQHYEEPAGLWDGDRGALEQAYGELEGMSDAGACFPLGISVGGVFIDIRDLWDMFPDEP